MDTSFRVQVSFTDETPDEVLSLLEEVGATKVKQVEEHGFVEIAVVFVGILIADTLANLVIKLTPLWKCGVVVDARGSTVLTQKDCNLPRGTVLVFSPDGTKSELHQPSEIDIQSVIKAAIANKS
jgi:hypothetical protein